jgi:hypothetical protein
MSRKRGIEIAPDDDVEGDEREEGEEPVDVEVVGVEEVEEGGPEDVEVVGIEEVEEEPVDVQEVGIKDKEVELEADGGHPGRVVEEEEDFKEGGELGE